MKRLGYLGVTLGLVALSTAAAVVGGRFGLAVGIGAGFAWIVQAASFWFLAGRLEDGQPVMRVWVTGIATRFGAGVLLWLLAVLAGAPTRELMMAYGLALAVFLIVEAGWLAVITSKPTTSRT